MAVKGEVVLVAVDASKEITEYALEWTICNVIKAMDCLILLATIPSRKCLPASGNNAHKSPVQHFLKGLLKKWGVRHRSDGLPGSVGIGRGIHQEENRRISEVGTQMMRELCLQHKISKVQAKVTVIADAETGSIAMKAEELGASWVILDRRLKKEGDYCSKHLINCNIILMDHTIPKILRLVDEQIELGEQQYDPTAAADMLALFPTSNIRSNSLSCPSSLGFNSCSPGTEVSDSSPSTGDKNSACKNINNQQRKTFRPQYSKFVHQEVETEVTHQTRPSYSKSQPLHKVSRFAYDEKSQKTSTVNMDRTKNYSGPLKSRNTATTGKYPPLEFTPSRRSTGSANMQWNSSKNQLQPQTISGLNSSDGKKWDLIIASSLPTIDRTSSVRRAKSLTIKRPLVPPPLCSICQYNASTFGKSPRKYSYQEIQRATGGFSSANFLAEGGYGPVFRGVMPDGQVVAVKQHMLLSSQGTSEFCSEIEVLSCVQHRNLAMLVGYCIEKELQLVYEFACNGSLDKHLYGTETSKVMTWQSRMKVAVGAARGLRYLHEDCRVGCIIHRDLRAKNILLTHDFEPMVGDFGLARWQANGQSAEEKRIIGSFGYLAPEYTQTGLITEKANVYAFGVVLLELLSGLKATDLTRSEEKHYLPEWGLRLCKKNMLSEILDPRLMGDYVDAEVESMMLAASLCISPSPDKRPRMSKVLRLLEGEMAYEHGGLITSTLVHKMKNSFDRRSFHETQELGTSHQVKLMHCTMASSTNLILNNSEHNKVETKPTYLEKFGVNKANDSWNMEQTDDFHSEEFQDYLKGSLAKFVEQSELRREN